MNVADYLVKILEEEGLENIFGLPGEQILPFYKALKDSKINHVLVKTRTGSYACSRCILQIIS